MTYKKLQNCKYCQTTFTNFTTSERANHSRWCDKNPKKESYIKNTNSMRSGITAESIERRNLGISKAHDNGAYKDAPQKSVSTKTRNGSLNHSQKTKDLIREKALQSTHRRLVRSIRQYMKTDGTIVMLDSSWEEILAKRLDDIGVEWIRPETPIRYTANDGKIHSYFPDFYLPHYNLFLDPKNPMAVIAQKDKLQILKTVMNNLVILETVESCKTYSPEPSSFLAI